MEKTTKAAILTKQKYPLVIDQITLPKNLDYGQVLIKVAYSGICGSQIGEIDGVKGQDPYLPHLMGHEGSGNVEKVGPGVSTVKDGDHVVLHWKKGLGIESQMPQYLWKGKEVNAGWITTFNEYAVISENRMTKIPKDFDLKIAALFGCAVTTGLGVINNDAQLKIGESIVVFGAGGVGLNIIQGASLVSAYPIVAVDLYPEKLALSKKFGATHCLEGEDPNIKEKILDIIGKQGANVTVDNTGNVKIIEMCYELAAKKSRTILVGVPKKGDKASLYSLPLHFGKKLSGSHGGQALPHADIPRYLNLVEQGKLQLNHLITDTFSLDEIQIAIENLRLGKIFGRCMIKM